VSGDIPSGARALVLTVSDGVVVGARHDESGIALADRLATAGFRVDRRSVSDERALIEAALREGAQDHVFVISTGGTGLTPRDVTPQATLAVIDYEVPGLAEAMRAAGRATTPMADLSRGVVGVIGRSLVVNVPGSPKAAVESLAAIEPTLGHAIETLAGPYDHDVEATPGLALHANEAMPAAATATRASLADEDQTEATPIPPGDPSDPWRDLPNSTPD
jgi:molybdenum cofactor synthesis domain-containing protein